MSTEYQENGDVTMVPSFYITDYEDSDNDTMVPSFNITDYNDSRNVNIIPSLYITKSRKSSEDSNNSNASSTGSINSSMSFISQHDPHQIMNSCEKLILKLLNDSQRLNSRLKKLELRAGLVEDQLPSFQRCASFPQTITEHPSEAECSSDMATVNYP
ncbi:uncharacterized protein LOC134819649 isoform X1 [Bolinopsis microptera]|uniref:uncharacterized protein LOC134819649 isoform X1 n=1 Tax=Bolinopsis microptera TaxID=2820187 RepID=UPI003079A5AB